MRLHREAKKSSFSHKYCSNNNHQCYGIKNKKSLVLRCAVAHSLRCATSYCDQHNGDQHHRNMLHRPVAGCGISLTPEHNEWAYEVEDQSEKELDVSKDESEQAHLVVGSRELFFALP